MKAGTAMFGAAAIFLLAGCLTSPYARRYELAQANGEGVRIVSPEILPPLRERVFSILKERGYDRFLHSDRKHDLFVVAKSEPNRIVHAVNPDAAVILVKFASSRKPPLTQIDFMKISDFKATDEEVETDLRKIAGMLAASGDGHTEAGSASGS